ncbi:CD225/dispanin family protein [Psychroflexus aestuariivivens]|uniref:CD225/dispanin family protein n=1 Tax=Psychroflexus aestuariivivens TaxID=1795040 RepID=UPI000FD6BE7D|nr:CD225/dispanin family protein [Psychroflexus aestuariivivens]
MEQSQNYNPKAPPPNYLAFAIITTILCCLPAGIVSIVYASEVNRKWMSQDYEGAYRASQNAKTWAIVSAVSFAGIFILIFIFYIFVGLTAFSFQH